MSDNPFDGQLDSGGRTVPRGRLSRLGQFGRLAGGVAGGMSKVAGRMLTSKWTQ